MSSRAREIANGSEGGKIRGQAQARAAAAAAAAAVRDRFKPTGNEQAGGTRRSKRSSVDGGEWGEGDRRRDEKMKRCRGEKRLKLKPQAEAETRRPEDETTPRFGQPARDWPEDSNSASLTFRRTSKKSYEFKYMYFFFFFFFFVSGSLVFNISLLELLPLKTI
ncbi:hypothetical protein BDBG_02657 [Blastomyces gilchristii SLH14081]|uniref:Uncharacterized protein n=1 Tax=Blastomyces gilchristii (strain SLH14081) TaxID=559298 RepID=A0A179UEL7_BLAGS|nr:uncharacterized protein BDBG_02657 [Blastomyces gilchristii SLH14081]OAT06465.1 hypothetical protein BDBG_02657 [Blastomyces gilchristii SLH14081]